MRKFSNYGLIGVTYAHREVIMVRVGISTILRFQRKAATTFIHDYHNERIRRLSLFPRAAL